MRHFRGTTAKLRASVAAFTRDERGGATIWNLTWLIGFAIMLGLAVDTTNARRHETMLQSTADVASLAGVLDIPNPYKAAKEGWKYDDFAPYPTVKFSATDYATRNMLFSQHGSYMQNDDIFIGHWDHDAREFTWGANFGTDPDTGADVHPVTGEPISVNAVQVWLGRNEENNNWVQTTYLRIAGQTHWNINTTATAAVNGPDCLHEGFMAYDKICVRSNNHFNMDTCLHGEQGLNFRNGNTYNGDVDASHGAGASNNIDESNHAAGLDVVGIRDINIPIVHDILWIAEGFVKGRQTALYYNQTSGDLHDADGGSVTVDVLNGEEDADGNVKQEEQYNISVHLLTDPNVTGTVAPPPQGAWWRGPYDVDVASMESFASMAGLLGLSQQGGGGGGGGPGQEGPGPFGCETGGAAGTAYDNSDINPAMARITAALPTFDGSNTLSDGSQLIQNQLYWHDGGPSEILRLSGEIVDAAIITTSRVVVEPDATLDNTTIISLYSGGSHGIKFGEGSALGRRDGCTDGGASIAIALGSIEGASGVKFYESIVAAGGNLHFAANADGFYGIAAYALGNVSFASGGTFGNGQNNCQAEVFIDDDELIYRLVQ